MGRKTPHQERALVVFERIVDIDGRGQDEVAIPRATFAIDHVRQLGVLSSLDPVIAAPLAGRLAVIELTARSLTERMLVNAMLKGIYVRHESMRSGARPRTDPVLWLVVARAGMWPSRAKLTEIERGHWADRVGGVLDVVVTSLDELGVRTGTSALHMMRTPSNTDARLVTEAFRNDPRIDERARAQLIEDIMNQAVPGTTSERRSLWQEAVHEGVEQGLEQGRQAGLEQGVEQGVQHARHALLDAAAAVVSADELASLSAIDDFAELARAVIAATAP